MNQGPTGTIDQVPTGFAPPPPPPSPLLHHHQQPGAGAYAPRRRGWWARNWKWAVPAGSVALVAGFAGVIVLFISAIFGLIRGSEVYQTAVTEARLAPAVVTALGTPIEEGFFVQGNIEVSPQTGYADLAIPLEGPGGTATIFVEAEKQGGEWAYGTLEVVVHASRERIDLLEDW